jgi:predicted nucleotidyltransferase
MAPVMAKPMTISRMGRSLVSMLANMADEKKRERKRERERRGKRKRVNWSCVKVHLQIV